MARQTDTATQSRTIALELLKQGIRPTVKRIREQLGPIGSDTTVHNALENEFWPEIGRRLTYPDLPDCLLEAMQTLWQLAVDTAKEEFVRYRQEMDQRAERAAAGYAELRLMHDQLNADLSHVGTELAQLKTDKADLERRLHSETKAHQQAAADLKQAKAIAEQTAQAIERAEIAHREVLKRDALRADEIERRLVAQFEEQRSLRIQAERRETELAKQQQALIEKSSDLRVQLAETAAISQQRESALAELTVSHESLRNELQMQSQALNKITAERETLSQQLISAAQSRLDTEVTLKKTERQLQSVEIKRAQAERENKVLQRQLGLITKRIKNALPENPQ